MARVRITVDGRLALTVEQAADRYGLTASSMRAAISRLHIQPAAYLDADRPDAQRRRGLYLAVPLDRAMRGRVGRGANLRHRSATVGPSRGYHAARPDEVGPQPCPGQP